MGTWGNGIKDNDTSSDIYGEFFELYNDGKSPKDISAKLIAENLERIKDSSTQHDFWFGLALAQWETKALDPNVYARVKSIIDAEEDLKLWKELDADEADIKRRSTILLKFLEKLQTERAKPKPRVKSKPVIGTPIFTKGTCLAFQLHNGNYGGAVVLDGYEDHKHGGYNYIAVCRLDQPSKPTLKDFENAELLITSFFGDQRLNKELKWHHSDGYAKDKETFEVVGEITVEKTYSYGGIGCISTHGWSYIKINTDRQIEFEKENPRPKERILISELTKDKKWWKL